MKKNIQKRKTIELKNFKIHLRKFITFRNIIFKNFGFKKIFPTFFGNKTKFLDFIISKISVTTFLNYYNGSEMTSAYETLLCVFNIKFKKIVIKIFKNLKKSNKIFTGKSQKYTQFNHSYFLLTFLKEKLSYGLFLKPKRILPPAVKSEFGNTMFIAKCLLCKEIFKKKEVFHPLDTYNQIKSFKELIRNCSEALNPKLSTIHRCKTCKHQTKSFQKSSIKNWGFFFSKKSFFEKKSDKIFNFFNFNVYQKAQKIKGLSENLWFSNFQPHHGLAFFFIQDTFYMFSKLVFSNLKIKKTRITIKLNKFKRNIVFNKSFWNSDNGNRKEDLGCQSRNKNLCSENPIFFKRRKRMNKIKVIFGFISIFLLLPLRFTPIIFV